MVKKLFLAILLIIVLAYPIRKLHGSVQSFYIDLGVLTDDSFSFNPFICSGGLGVMFFPIDKISVAPECSLIVQKFKFNNLYLAPALILNLHLQSLYLGGGFTKWIYLGKENDPLEHKVSLKLNGGLLGNSMRLNIYLITPFKNLFAKGMTVGMTIGFIF